MSDLTDKLTKRKSNFYLIWAIIGACVLVGTAVYMLRILAVPVAMVIWTVIFVFCLRGIVNWLQQRGVSRILGTAISYVIMFAILGVIGVLMFSPMFGLNEQFADIIASIPSYVDQAVKWGEGMYDQYANVFDNDTFRSIIANVGTSLSSGASSLASGAAGAAVDLGSGIASTLMSIGFGLVIAFWVLMELPAIGAEVKRIIPERRYADAHFLHITFTRTLGGYIRVTLIQCLIIGVVCGILFAIIGIPNAPAMGVITGVLNVLPIIGPWLGGAAAAISAVFVSPIKALIAFAGTIVIQQSVYTFVSPRLMASSVNVHPALQLVVMMVGSALGAAMGGLVGSLVGILFSIPATAVVQSCFVYEFEKRTKRQIMSKDGVFFKGDARDLTCEAASESDGGAEGACDDAAVAAANAVAAAASDAEKKPDVKPDATGETAKAASAVDENTAKVDAKPDASIKSS